MINLSNAAYGEMGMDSDVRLHEYKRMGLDSVVYRVGKRQPQANWDVLLNMCCALMWAYYVNGTVLKEYYVNDTVLKTVMLDVARSGGNRSIHHEGSMPVHTHHPKLMTFMTP
eukprot:140596-Amphidinium_carterae.1